MRIESDGHSRGNPRLYELIEHAPEDREEPDRVGLAAADRLPQGRRPAGAGTVAAAPGAPARSRGRVAARSRSPTRRRPPAARTRRRPRHPSRSQRPEGDWRIVSVAVPLRGPALARRGDRPAARRRRRGQGAGRRAEPGPAAEAALRLARAARRHQQHARPRLPPGRRRTARSASARCAGTPTWSARRCSPASAADDGRRRAADRRPDRAQPRHAGRLAVPRRPAGRLGVGRDRARRPRRRRRARAAGARSRSREFVTGPVPERRWPTTRSRSRRSIPAPQGGPAGGYLKLERRVGDFATAGVAVALETAGETGHPGRHRPDRRRRLDHRRRRRRGTRSSAGRSTAATIEQAADLAAQAARPRTDHRGSAEYKRHIVHTFVVRILDPRRRADGEGGLT